MKPEGRLLVHAPSEAFKLLPLLERAVANLSARFVKHLTPAEDTSRDESKLATEWQFTHAGLRDAVILSQAPQDALKRLHRSDGRNRDTSHKMMVTACSGLWQTTASV